MSARPPSAASTTSPAPSTAPEAPSSSASDDENADLPLPIAASVMLDQLPQNTHHLLETAGEIAEKKVKIALKPMPNTRALAVPVFMCATGHRFQFVVNFVRRKMGVKEHESVFCYVNSVFAPGLDEGVGNLYACFKQKDVLVVHYSITQAYG